jgi:hypothetical protein
MLASMGWGDRNPTAPAASTSTAASWHAAAVGPSAHRRLAVRSKATASSRRCGVGEQTSFSVSFSFPQNSLLLLHSGVHVLPKALLNSQYYYCWRVCIFVHGKDGNFRLRGEPTSEEGETWKARDECVLEAGAALAGASFAAPVPAVIARRSPPAAGRSVRRHRSSRCACQRASDPLVCPGAGAAVLGCVCGAKVLAGAAALSAAAAIGPTVAAFQNGAAFAGLRRAPIAMGRAGWDERWQACLIRARWCRARHTSARVSPDSHV